MANRKVKAARLLIISKIVLVVLKLAVGTATRSVSVISEAVHSGIDLFAAVIAFFSLREAGKTGRSRAPVWTWKDLIFGAGSPLL